MKLLASNRNYSDSRWYSETDIQRKNWTLKENATPEFLEINSDNEYYLQKFYNAADINEVEKLETENQTLEEVLDFLIVRDILETDGEIIFAGCIGQVYHKINLPFTPSEEIKILQPYKI